MPTKEYYEAHKEESKARNKAYREAHKEEYKARDKAYREAHKKEYNAYQNAYQKADVNSAGRTKHSIRESSRKYLYNTLKFQKIDNYARHHCFTYDDYKQFIYIPVELHHKIHQFLRDNDIDADTNHFEQIKHLLDNCKEKIYIIKDEKVTEY